MIRLNWHELPEIELTDSRVSFGPEDISLATDSIEINVKMRNLGKAIIDTFDLTINRNFPNSNIDSNYVFNIPGLNYERTLNFKLPLQSSQGIGINKFTIKVDRPNFIEEQYDELINNQVVKNFLINVDGVEPVTLFNEEDLEDGILKSTLPPLCTEKLSQFRIDLCVDCSIFK